MFAGFGTPAETNQRFKFLLDHGETGLSTAFDMPTLYGYDTDAPQASGEFGRCGAAVSSLPDMEELFQDIPLDQVTTSMTINSPAAVIWAMYLAMAQRRGIPWDKLGGTLQNDIIKEFTAQNEYIFPPNPPCAWSWTPSSSPPNTSPAGTPSASAATTSGRAGATAVQELAFTLADGMAYVDRAIQRGLDVDDFAPRISFFFNVHTTSWKRSPSSAPPAASGPPRCATATTPATPAHGGCAATRRPPASPSPPSSRR